MPIQYIACRGEELRPYLEELAKLRIAVFREYPYLYEGSLEYEQSYCEVYSKSPRSQVTRVKIDGQFAGATTCIPLADESLQFQKPFLEAGYDVNRIFYFGESVLLPQYRGHGIGRTFFEIRLEHAYATLPELQYTTFCAVDRPEDHPQRPADYRPLHRFWQSLGYVQHAGLKAYLPWKEIGETKEIEKAMTFWLRRR